MDANEVVARLTELGTEQNRKVYARHGDGPTFGVSFANIYALRKAIKRDQALADELWAVRVFEPQALACMIADPSSFGRTKLQKWVRESLSYAVADEVAKYVVVKTLFAGPMAHRWIAMKTENAQRAGWSTFGLLAETSDEPDSTFLELLPLIERDIHISLNRTTQAMNSALIAFGGRSPALRKAATASARRIGPVSVDHGETYCKTPDAIPYIEKIWARRGTR